MNVLTISDQTIKIYSRTPLDGCFYVQKLLKHSKQTKKNVGKLRGIKFVITVSP